MNIGTRDIVDDAMAAAKLYLDSVYTVWSEQDSDIMFKRNAISFDPSINLSNTTGKSKGPALAASDNNVYVVWSDDSLGNFDILFRRSTDGGASFGGTVNLSNTTGSSRVATVATSMINPSQQDVYVVWSDDALGKGGIVYRKSTDGGASFGRTMSLASVSEKSPYSVAVSGNNVYIVWNDFIPVTGNREILYRKSTDGGALFGRTVNLSNTTGNSSGPVVAASSNLTL